MEMRRGTRKEQVVLDGYKTLFSMATVSKSCRMRRLHSEGAESDAEATLHHTTPHHTTAPCFAAGVAERGFPLKSASRAVDTRVPELGGGRGVVV
jgi:hypothetical protein